MIEIMVLSGVVLVALLVMASGVWVAIVLITAVMRAKRPASSAKDHSVDSAVELPSHDP